VLNVRSEATDRLLIFGEWHLRRVLEEYARHYNGWRPQRALALNRPGRAPVVDLTRSGSNAGRSSAASSPSTNEPRNLQARPRDASLEPHRRWSGWSTCGRVDDAGWLSL
jgi:hypothetical protein